MVPTATTLNIPTPTRRRTRLRRDSYMAHPSGTGSLPERAELIRTTTSNVAPPTVVTPTTVITAPKEFKRFLPRRLGPAPRRREWRGAWYSRIPCRGQRGEHLGGTSTTS